MDLYIIDGGRQEVELNQELETLESEIAQARQFVQLSPSQQYNYVRCRQIDPMAVASSLLREAGQFYSWVAERYL